MTTEAPATIRLRTHIYKGCQRCGGDLRLERAAEVPIGGKEYEYVCLQCGRSASVRNVVLRMQELRRPVAA